MSQKPALIAGDFDFKKHLQVVTPCVSFLVRHVGKLRIGRGEEPVADFVLPVDKPDGFKQLRETHRLVASELTLSGATDETV